MKRSLRQILVAGALAISAAVVAGTAAAAPLAQPGRTDYDGNGVTDARDLVSFVAQWVVDAGLSAAPTPDVSPTVTPSAPATTTPSPTIAVATSTATPVPSTTPQPPPARRMVVVVLENRNLSDVQAHPYFASLAARGRLLTNYVTIANPSQPNYVALNFGDTMGVVDNSLVDIPGRNIVDLLEEGGISWRTYHEAYPGGCYAGYYPPGSELYARKHNAFISANSVRNDPARCAKIVDGLAFDADVASGTLPRYSLYVPDENNSSHDTTIAYAANWLQGWLGPKLDDPSLKDVIWVITWDEGEVNGPVPISTILIGPGITPGTTDGATYTHYSLLRTTQAFFGLGSLGRNDASAPLIPLTGPPAPIPSVTPSRTPTFLPVITNTATRTATPTRTPGVSMSFPTTPILDNFNRADGALTTNWTADVRGSGHAMPQIVSNQISQTAGSARRSATWNTSFSGRTEVYFKIKTAPTDQSVVLGFYYTPNSLGQTDGYECTFNSSGVITLVEFLNDYTGGSTTHYTSATGAFTANDVVGLVKDDVAGTISIYKNGTLVTTVTENTWSGTMKIGFSIRGNAAIDDFGGGRVQDIFDMIDSGGVIAFAR